MNSRITNGVTLVLFALLGGFSPFSVQAIVLNDKGIDYQCVTTGELNLENLRISRLDGKKILGKDVQNYTDIVKTRKKKKALKKKYISNPALAQKLIKVKEQLKNIKIIIRLLNECLDLGGGLDDKCDSDFTVVSNIIQQNCMSCHNAALTSRGVFQPNNEDWFVANGLVVPGSHENSELYLRLRNNPEGIGPRNMPSGADSLSQADIAAMRCWINTLESNAGDSFSFACNAELDPSPMPLMRLSAPQFRNAVIRILEPLSVLPQDYVNIWSMVQAELNLAPPDNVPKAFLEERDFPNLDNSFSQTLLDSIYRIAALIGYQINSTSQRRIAFAGCDAGSSSAGQACLEGWIQSFGQTVFRRPLTPTELARFIDFFESRPIETAMADTILLFLMQPHFLFHVEVEGAPVPNKSNLYYLTPYEKAARLAFSLWQAPPNDQLYSAAANGTLDTAEGYREAVNTIFADLGQQRTREMIHEFWWQHLELDLVPPLNAANTSAFNNFDGDLNIEPGGESLIVAMNQEILDLTDYHTFGSAGNFRDLMRSTVSVTDNPTLAAIYGVSPHLAGGPAVHLAKPRSLLERAVMLLSGDWRNLPVKRGGRFYRLWMCQPLSPPPPELENSASIPPPDSQASTRATYTALTGNQPCISCHAKINPLGFAMETYDALGRERTQENIYSASGAVLATHTIDSVVEAELAPGQSQVLSGPQELLDAALETGRMDGCLAQQYYRFINRRREDLLGDGCALEQLRSALAESGGSLASFFKEVVLSESFKYKKALP